MKIALPARPEPIEIDREQTAVLLVDMQNAFASTGGMLDLAGIDVKPAAAAVANARVVVDAARDANVPVIYLVMGYPPDQSTAGGDDSPNPRKEIALCLMRERPELRGKLLTIGTWDFQIVDALAPARSDPVITKSRYNGFAGTPLDAAASQPRHPHAVDGWDRIQRVRRIDTARRLLPRVLAGDDRGCDHAGRVARDTARDRL